MHKKILFIIIIFSILSGCNGKLPGADARKFSKNPDHLKTNEFWGLHNEKLN